MTMTPHEGLVAILRLELATLVQLLPEDYLPAFIDLMRACLTPPPQHTRPQRRSGGEAPRPPPTGDGLGSARP